MTVPSLEQFDFAISLANARFASVLQDRFDAVYGDDGEFLSNKEDELRSIVGNYLQLRDAQWREIDRSEAYRWMVAQPGFVAAADICFRGKRRRKQEAVPSTNELIEVHLSRLRRFRASADVLVSDRLSRHWSNKCVEAFREYFHTSNSEIALKAAKRLDEIERDVLRIGDELGVLANALLWDANRPQLSLRWLQQIDLIRRNPLLSIIKRDGKQNRERLLAKRLFDANRRAFRATKADAITELLTVEGIEHQVDYRTVQRWCAAYAEAAVAQRAAKVQ